MPPTDQLEFSISKSGMTQNDLLAAILVANQYEWFEMTWLGRQIGAWAVHSRVADVRRQLAEQGLGTIEQRSTVDPVTGKRHSAYRFVPTKVSSCNLPPTPSNGSRQTAK